MLDTDHRSGVFVSVGALLAVFVFVPVAGACSCIGPFPEEWLKEASLVFRGRVTGTQDITEHVDVGGVPTVRRAEKVTFVVLERFKGPDHASYSVLTGECEAPVARGGECFDLCKATLGLSREYMVFAWSSKAGGHTISMCDTYDVELHKENAKYCLKRLRRKKS